jgi:hypothetical protein
VQALRRSCLHSKTLSLKAAGTSLLASHPFRDKAAERMGHGASQLSAATWIAAAERALAELRVRWALLAPERSPGQEQRSELRA